MPENSMLEEVMRHCKNFFPVKCGSTYGNWIIAGGAIGLPFVQTGQYFRIEGSALNDGVYQHGTEELIDEEFCGWIAPLAVPRAFLSLVAEIEQWQEKNGASAASPYSSESFNGYSYSKAQGTGGGAVSWQDAFKSRLNVWRCI